ncbi:MAG: YciI family protein [Gammaproteobacteria bacterium]|nr:YciI family protein [Gammaproteobacteria bacterium]
MKFVCLGYIDEGKWESLSERERHAMMDECFGYDDELRAKGHFAGGEALGSARTAVTLQYRQGKLSVTDGPFAETKEVLGGILVLEARDMDHAIELMSKHPGVRAGPFEIRPAADLGAMIAASEARRRAAGKR